MRRVKRCLTETSDPIKAATAHAKRVRVLEQIVVKNSIGAAYLLLSLLFLLVQLIMPGAIYAEGGESATAQGQSAYVGGGTPTNDQGPSTEAAETPPTIHTDLKRPTAWVAGVPIQLPDAECARLVSQALQQKQEVAGADNYCRSLMQQALELQRNAAPVKAQEPPAVLREIPDTPAQPPAAQPITRSKSSTPPLGVFVPDSQ